MLLPTEQLKIDFAKAIGESWMVHQSDIWPDGAPVPDPAVMMDLAAAACAARMTAWIEEING